MPSRNTIEDFHSKYTKQPGCWGWNGSLRRTGTDVRGRITIDGKDDTAPRWAYRVFVGEIPEGMNINHHCDNPLCVNPDHLYLGTQLDNVRDMVSRRRVRGAPGVKNANVILDDDKVREILASTEKNVEIAKKYGVSNVLIGLIKNGKAWRHINRG